MKVHAFRGKGLTSIEKGDTATMVTSFPVQGRRINGPCRPRRETVFAVKRRKAAPGAPERIARNEVEGSRVGIGLLQGPERLDGVQGRPAPAAGLLRGRRRPLNPRGRRTNLRQRIRYFGGEAANDLVQTTGSLFLFSSKTARKGCPSLDAGGIQTISPKNSVFEKRRGQIFL